MEIIFVRDPGIIDVGGLDGPGGRPYCKNRWFLGPGRIGSHAYINTKLGLVERTLAPRARVSSSDVDVANSLPVWRPSVADPPAV